MITSYILHGVLNVYFCVNWMELCLIGGSTLWNHTVSSFGGKGNKFKGDLRMEHFDHTNKYSCWLSRE